MASKQMAGNSSYTKKQKVHGVAAKTKTAKHKGSKNYKKAYVGQG